MDNDLPKKIFGSYAKEALNHIMGLNFTKGDKLNTVTKEYIDKILKLANLDSKDYDIPPECIWSYVIGMHYGIKSGKDTEGE